MTRLGTHFALRFSLAFSLILAFFVVSAPPVSAQAPVFRAGVAAIDISPVQYPVRVNGMFNERSADSAVDPLYARAFALDDGATTIVFCIVDTCMMEQDLIDAAKRGVLEATGVPMDRMMVSATHTHSAPSAMGCLGSRQDPDYAAWLPEKLTEAMVSAVEALQPARIGWAFVDDWEHTHNRRWIRRADKTFDDPFGDLNVRAHMHPGYESVDVIGPSGPVDPGLSVLAATTPDGTPLALLANYSQHYYSSPLLSADYFGAFARIMAKHLGQSSSEGPFVAMMSQGTSGDLMWMDYGSPQKEGNFESYAEEVAEKALEAWKAIEWHDHVPLGMTEKVINLAWRVPDADRLARARERVAALEGALPKSREDIYAHEVIILHERQRTDLKLQAIRVGDLTMATLPNEVYALTGLKLKAQAPLGTHFNIELANGSVGYIPPPEQHELGGYTTWPARTAGLEIQAEPVIVETLLAALESVSGAKRKAVVDGESTYSRAVNALNPVSYWRLNEMEGRIAHNAVAGGPEGRISGGAALYLPGPGSGTGWGAREHLRPSNFSAPDQINRAVHFVADGRLEAEVPGMGGDYSIAIWFWLGERSGVSAREGGLVTLPTGERLRYAMDAGGNSAVFLLRADDASTRFGGHTRITAGDWHSAVLTRSEGTVELYLDGALRPEATLAMPPRGDGGPLVFGDGLEGKLDEIAIFDQVLTPEERYSLWEASAMAVLQEETAAEWQRGIDEARARAQVPDFSPSYGDAIAALTPALHSVLDDPHSALEAESGVQRSPAGFAQFSTGRMQGSLPVLGASYTVSLWFKNTMANDARSVTAYLFSRGPKSDVAHTGDHLGIGGTYPDQKNAGKLILFNGNTANQVVAGRTPILPGTWNHVVFVRDGNHVTVWLNGSSEPEIDADLPATAAEEDMFFLGARSDHFAPLSGYMAQFSLFDRALRSTEALAIHAASGAPSGAATALPAPAPENPQLSSLPLSPAEGLASIHVPEGYTVDLVASEPQLLDPVAFDWDVYGRLWVVEMADYPLGLDGAGASGGRVRVLEDRDQDGAYETSSLFADGLNFPTGILTWRDGVIVTAAPDILFLRDTTGDGVADEREVLLSGLSEGNQQLRANGLRWGLDNWVYVAAGGHHGKYALDTKLLSTRTGKETVIGSRDFRFRPDSGDVEPQSGPTQFGRNRDEWGHWFGTQNARPLWHYALPDHYLQRNPYFAAPDGQVQILGLVGPPVYPASPLEKRYHDFKASGQFTSACSGMIYRDRVLFRSDEMTGFTCEPFHNLVQRIALEPDGVTFRGTRVAPPNAPDFFASEDRWCRPVMVRTGPDGGLWVADMYRYMIEHPQWLPEEGRAELLPHYREGDDKGRIYRVRPADSTLQPLRDLDTLATPDLVALLQSTNGWVRDKVQQLLLWRDDPTAIPELETMAREYASPLARLHALCTLDGLNALGDALVVHALSDRVAGVRENALRLAETRASSAVVDAALELAGDPEPKVRQQLAFSLGAFPATPETGAALADLLLQNDLDPFITAAALSSALTHQEHLVGELVAREDAVRPPLRRQLAEIALGAENAASAAALLTPVLAAASDTFAQDTADACADMLDLLARRGTSVAALQAGAVSGPQAELQQTYAQLVGRARAVLNDEGASAEKRISAATVLARIPEEEARVVAYLTALVDGLTPPRELRRTMAVLAHTTDERVPERFVEAWPGLVPQAREEAADVLLSSAAWTQRLIEAIAAGDIRVTDLSQVRRTQLLNHPNDELRALAAAQLEGGANPERAEVISAFQDALTLPGDGARGKVKYAELCASCHKLDDVGFEIGPDLRTVRQHPKEKLLANILDPNLDIQPGYHAYNCETQDGELLFGLISSENATSITMKLPGNKLRTVLRSDIYELSSTSLSMMPDGLEAALTPQDMADLIAFLKAE